MSRGLPVVDRAIEGVQFAFFAGDPRRVVTRRTRRELRLLLGRVRQRIGRNRGGHPLSDDVRGAFDLGKREPLRVGNRVKIGALESRQHLPSNASEFFIGQLGKRHGKRGGNGKGVSRHRATPNVKIRTTQYTEPNSSANRVLHPASPRRSFPP